jgi:hypothetical protein
MYAGGNDSTKNKIKEILSGAANNVTTRGAQGSMKIGRRTRDAFFITSTAIVALVALTAISYRPAGVVADARDVASDVREESVAPAPVTFDAVRYPLTYVVRVVLASGNEVYLDERTAAMLGAVKFANADVINVALR